MLKILNQYRASFTLHNLHCGSIVDIPFQNSLHLFSILHGGQTLSQIYCRFLYHSIIIPPMQVPASLSLIKTCTRSVIDRFILPLKAVYLISMALYDVQHLSITIAFGLTVGILVNMTLKQVSNVTCSWFDPLPKLQSMYHNDIPISIAQELFRVNRSHISNIH